MSAPKRLLNMRILIVEDDYFIMSEMKRTVKDAGGIITGTYASVSQILLDGPAISSDAAVLDINLRGQMSYTLADALLSRGIPFVFVTGQDPECIPERYRQIPRLLKPFNSAGLIDILASACAKRR